MRFDYIKVVVILFLFTFSACRQTTRNTNRVNRLSATGNVIKIRDIDLDREFSWNDKLDSITIIPLENSAQAMIGRVTKAEVHNGRLIILDMLNRRLLVFDAETGAFISSIGSRGKGPGEYAEPRDFTIVGDTIFVLDYLDVKKYSMLDYHYLGNYRISQELIGEINPVQFLFYGDNQFYLWNNGKHQIDKHVGVYDLNFYKNGKLDKVYGLNDRHIKSFDENRFFHTYKGFYLVAPPVGHYGIAKIDRDKVNSFVKLDFGSDSVSSKDIDMWKKSPEFLNLYLKSNRFKEISDLVLLDENKLYFSCIGPGSYRYEGILDLNEHSVEFGKHSNNYSPFILCSDGNYVYAYYDPARLRKSIGDKSKNNQIFDRFVSEMKGTYDEKSNLILVRFSLKR